MSYSDILHADSAGWRTLRSCLAEVPQKRCFRLHTCFRLTVPPSWAIPSRVNEDLHLLLVRGGKGEYRLGGRTIPLRRGVLLFVGCGVRHAALPDPQDLPQITAVRFGLVPTGARRTRVPPLHLAFRMEPVAMERLEPLFDRLWQCSARPDPVFTPLCSSLLHLILAELVRERDQQTRDPRVLRLCERIEQNPALRLGVADLAKQVRLCPRQLNRLFQEHTGLTPLAYQIRARLSQAQKLLCETALSLKEIAAALQYPDAYAFSRQFKQFIGTSPSAYRKQTTM